MRAGSPMLSAGSSRRSRRTLRSPLRRSSSSKSPKGETPIPVFLLQDLNLCYQLLKQLVPGLPPERAASRVEILQHVIDYILDLQRELDEFNLIREEPDVSVIHRCQVFESREPLRSPARDV